MLDLPEFPYSDEVKDTCRAVEFILSQTEFEIYRALVVSKEPCTASELVDKTGYSSSTVYRNLDKLREEGLVGKEGTVFLLEGGMRTRLVMQDYLKYRDKVREMDFESIRRE